MRFMRKSFWKFSLHFIISMYSLNMCALNASMASNVVQENIESHFDAKALFIVQVDLPKALLENIRLLNEEIKHTWPDAKYYRETIDFGKVFPALEEGYLIERPIPDFIAEIRHQLFQVFKNQMHEDLTAADYDNCIITIYQSGNGIAPHIDRNFDGQVKMKIANIISTIL